MEVSLSGSPRSSHHRVFAFRTSWNFRLDSYLSNLNYISNFDEVIHHLFFDHQNGFQQKYFQLSKRFQYCWFRLRLLQNILWYRIRLLRSFLLFRLRLLPSRRFGASDSMPRGLDADRRGNQLLPPVLHQRTALDLAADQILHHVRFLGLGWDRLGQVRFFYLHFDIVSFF